MTGLWRNQKATPEGKYLVQRRDGSIPTWEWFVIGERDPAAAAALFAYARKAESLGFDPQYVQDIRNMASKWSRAHELGHATPGDPDGEPHRKDDPLIVEAMKHREMK